MVKIGQNIKKIRLILEMNQNQFADSIQITQGALSKIEKGTKTIDPEILARIASVYELSLDWLILDKGSPPNFGNTKSEEVKKSLQDMEDLRS